MSAAVKLSTKLPGDETINGIDHWRQKLVHDPEELVVAIVYLDVQKITVNTDDGTEIPTVRVRRIEPLGPISSISDTVRAAVAAAEEERTGRKALPFEIVEAGEYGHSDTLDDA